MRNIYPVIRNRRPLKQTQRLLVLLIAVALVSINADPSLSAARRKGGQPAIGSQAATLILTGTFLAVNNGPGNQTNPHVDCNLASYTNDDFQGSSTIHYFDFTTNTDHVVPGNQLDLLSDIAGSRIAFTEVRADGEHVIVYDIASQASTIFPGAGKSNPSIGGNLVAFEDRSFLPGNQSEISLYDLSTGTVTRLTNDTLFDKNPFVSPTGDAVVWEKCQTNGLGCDVYAATQTSPGVFTNRALTSGGGEDRFPRTNGQLVVYTSDRSGETDIYTQPLAGGAETHLTIPGDQRDLNISGDLISFESRGQLGYDVFVYDLSTGTLYQVTNTPGVDETLTDISSCNGVGRLVYAIPGAGDFDVYAFTFQVPSSNPNQINDLIALVQSFNLPAGTENSLITKLQDALAAISVSDTATACICLTSFINECHAQSGKKLTADQANQLINSANQIKTDLGCQ
jgi:hypothetical protein